MPDMKPQMPDGDASQGQPSRDEKGKPGNNQQQRRDESEGSANQTEPEKKSGEQKRGKQGKQKDLTGKEDQTQSQTTLDLDSLVSEGLISQETCENIKAYMEAHKPEEGTTLPPDRPEETVSEDESLPNEPALPEEAPQGVPEHLLQELLDAGIITESEFEVLRGLQNETNV